MITTEDQKYAHAAAEVVAAGGDIERNEHGCWRSVHTCSACGERFTLTPPSATFGDECLSVYCPSYQRGHQEVAPKLDTGTMYHYGDFQAVEGMPTLFVHPSGLELRVTPSLAEKLGPTINVGFAVSVTGGSYTRHGA